jgi:p24 family protein delta-1
MRKLEGIVKEVVDELEYLKQREERFSDTNRQSYLRILVHRMLLTLSSLQW